MKCCCIILNYNGYKETIKLLSQIEDYHFTNIIIVDNCSTDDSFAELKKKEDSKVIVLKAASNGGYGSGNNIGLRYAFHTLCADAALICNPDVCFREVLLDKLEETLRQYPLAGIVSSVQHDRNDKEISMSAWEIPKPWNYIFSLGTISKKRNINFYYTKEYLHSSPVVQVDCVAGSLLLMTKEAFKRTGGYDEEMFLYAEETAIGCKLKCSGLYSYCRSDISYMHIHGVSITKSVKSRARRKKMLFRSHHYVLKRYLHANLLQREIDLVVGAVSIIEEIAKGIIKE